MGCILFFSFYLFPDGFRLCWNILCFLFNILIARIFMSIFFKCFSIRIFVDPSTKRFFFQYAWIKYFRFHIYLSLALPTPYIILNLSWPELNSTLPGNVCLPFSLVFIISDCCIRFALKHTWRVVNCAPVLTWIHFLRWYLICNIRTFAVLLLGHSGRVNNILDKTLD